MRNTMKRKHGSTLTTQTLLDFDLGESSSDSDFRIEDHDDESDDFSMGSKDDNDGDNDDDDDDDGDDDDDDDDDASDEDENESDDEGVEVKHLLAHSLNGTVKKKKKSEADGADDSGDAEDNDEEDEESTTDGSATKEKPASLEPQAVQPVPIPTPPSVKNSTINEKDAAVLKLLLKSICCACLGDRSDDQNEIVECDGCGVTVHEGCYGVSECTSISSTTSSCSTEPWFCDACKAGVENPDCELCPNRGGIFKETDVGKWVHLVCALYVPGVAFGEVDQLSSVTLFEMPYNKWGAKTCSLCEDTKLARTGVCIGCDAGMCKTYFHVTCAQYHGLLSEAHSEEADQADPFYAHCKIHSDKTLIKHRKRNYNAIKMKALHRQIEEEEASRKQQTQSSEQARIERKLAKHRKRYLFNKETKNPPWVPTQKMPRLLITSATACKKLLFKAELMGLDMAAIEFQEAQMAALTDVRKKWHITPAFSVEFIGYYLDRAIRLGEMKKNLQEQILLNKRLLGQQQQLRSKYDRSVQLNQEALKRNDAYRESIAKLYAHIQALAPSKTLVPIEQIGKPPQPAPLAHPPIAAVPFGKVTPHASVLINTPSAPSTVALCPTPPARTMTVPTAAALKMGVGFPLQNLLVPGGGKRDDTGRILSTQCKQNSEDLLNECGICKRCQDQHLLAKCDTCHLYYHLGCLNPPLTRHPKKSKLYGWQCSECDRSDDSNPESIIIPKAPRKSRTRYSKDGTIVPYDLSYAADQQQQQHEGGSSVRKAGKTSMTTGGGTPASTARPPPDPASTKSPVLQGSIATVKQEEEPTSPAPEKVESSTSLSSTGEDGSGASESMLQGTPPKVPGKRGRKKKIVPELSTTLIVQLDDVATRRPSLLDQLNNHDSKLPYQKLEPAEAAKNPESAPYQKHANDNTYYGDAAVQLKQENVGASDSTTDRVPAPSEKVESTTTTTPTPGGLLLPPAGSSSQINTSAGAMKFYGHNEGADIGPNKSNVTEAATSTHHKHSKRRKEKHRNRSPNAERIISKDHKRKRKRRNHDYDLASLADGGDYTMQTFDGDSRPRIKIKIKSVLDGSNTHTTQIFYVRDETGPERAAVPQLISGAADSSSHMQIDADPTLLLEVANLAENSTNSPQVDSTPQKSISSQARGRAKRHSIASRTGGAAVSNSATEESVCDVCQEQGTAANIVQCDECHKNYHFGCLDPPLKKTPKRRGYSWHCADCDPTDVEN
ncbi:PHD finger protein 14 [Anopheles ziemanni]|uniref:PHD finger protein 14 n=1 Tax=Anopheles ziemanni TaxID=345580 RepID=UPI00265AB041|nr:PHD finger protein 14 isoform X1 [Anopheles coustani]XP_058176169.1 PHD finger protein 14 [Anopheles ziemanni]